MKSTLLAITVSMILVATSAVAGNGKGQLQNRIVDLETQQADQDGRLDDLEAAPGGEGTVTQVNTGVGLTGGPITAVGIIALDNTSVSPGAYTNADITVDAQGRITTAADGQHPAPIGSAVDLRLLDGNGQEVVLTSNIGTLPYSFTSTGHTNARMLIDYGGCPSHCVDGE